MYLFGTVIVVFSSKTLLLTRSKYLPYEVIKSDHDLYFLPLNGFTIIVSFCLISVAIIDTAPSSDFTSKIRPGNPSNLNGPNPWPVQDHACLRHGPNLQEAQGIVCVRSQPNLKHPLP